MLPLLRTWFRCFAPLHSGRALNTHEIVPHDLRQRLRLGGPFSLLLIFTFLVTGLFTRDPWKADDAIQLGIVIEMLNNGQWLAPHLPGRPPSPPLFHWVAGAISLPLSSWIPLHLSVRVSSLFWTLSLCWLVGRAAHRWYGNSWLAPVTLIGCLGLLIHSHENQPGLALMTCIALHIWGLSLLKDRSWHGIAASGFGMAGIFFSSGISLLPAALITSILGCSLGNPGHTCQQQTRGLKYLAASFATALIPIVFWLIAVSYNNPREWSYWILNEKNAFGRPDELLSFLGMLTWYAWPALPLAAWTLWKERLSLREDRLLLPLVSFVGLLLCLASSASAKSATALPLLVPLCLLAVPAFATLQRGAVSALDWFAVSFFTVAAALIWLGWSAIYLDFPPKIARNFDRIIPGFNEPVSWFSATLALVTCGVWWHIAFRLPRRPYTPMLALVHWTSGLTLVWVLVILLWLPWINFGKSYRSVSSAVAKTLPAGYDCIDASHLSDAQKITLQYFESLRFGGSTCSLALTTGSKNLDTSRLSANWNLLWEGRRPADRNEILRLYQKQ